MFESDDRDGVTDTIWNNVLEREDDIVLYPESGEDGISKLPYYLSRQDEREYDGVKSIKENTFYSKNELSTGNMGSNYHLCTKELPGSRYPMDTFSNSTGNGYGEDCSNVNNHGVIVDDFTDGHSIYDEDGKTFTELCLSDDILDDINTSFFKQTHDYTLHSRAEGDSKASVFSSENGQKEVDTFLDCDWGSITDFDELDGILGDGGSIFGQEMAKDVDELLSPTNSTSAAPFLMHDISVSTAGKNSCSFQENRNCQGERKNSKDDMGDGKKRKSQKKLEAKGTREHPKSISACSSNGNHIQLFEKAELNKPFSTSSRAFSSFAFPNGSLLGGHDYMGYYSPNQQAFTGYGYPAFPFPILPPVHPLRGQTQPAASISTNYSQTTNCPNSVHSEKVSKLKIMTPQEKIEKLRRRQKMQAMLAIKQQGEQFSQQVGHTDISLSQKMIEMNQCTDSVLNSTEKTKERAQGVCLSKANMGQVGSHVISATSNDYTLQEKIFFEFQEVVMKLDNNLRLCMKQSILRLAKGVMERRSANDKSSINANSTRDITMSANERFAAVPRAESHTNATDRIIVNLLFHPVTTFTRSDKDKMPFSHIPGNTDQSSRTVCASEEKSKNVEE